MSRLPGVSNQPNLPLASGCYAANIPAHEHFKKSLHRTTRIHLGGEWRKRLVLRVRQKQARQKLVRWHPPVVGYEDAERTREDDKNAIRSCETCYGQRSHNR